MVELEFADGVVADAEFHVMDVTKPLASMAKLVDRGSWVVFRPDGDGGSYFWAPDGSKKLFRQRGVCFLPCWVSTTGLS